MDSLSIRGYRNALIRVASVLVALAVGAGCATTSTSSSSVSGVFGPSYKEGVINNQQLQNAVVADIVKRSSGLFNYASNIYANSPKASGDQYLVIDEGFSDRRFGDMSNFIDTNIFKTYCQAKGGDVFKWYVQGDFHAYSGFKGISKTFFTCETESQVEAVLIYEDFGRGQKYLGPMPYEQRLTLATGKFFGDLIRDYKLEGYVSSNKMVTIPVTMITDPKTKKGPATEKYSMLFSYKNEKQVPIELNILSSYVLIKSDKLDLDFTFRNEPIFWTSYDNLSRGVFVGTKSGYMTRLRLVPNQRFSGQVIFSVPGMSAFKETDFAELTIVIDKNKCTDFKRTSYYELFKERQ